MSPLPARILRELARLAFIESDRTCLGDDESIYLANLSLKLDEAADVAEEIEAPKERALLRFRFSQSAP